MFPFSLTIFLIKKNHLGKNIHEHFELMLFKHATHAYAAYRITSVYSHTYVYSHTQSQPIRWYVKMLIYFCYILFFPHVFQQKFICIIVAIINSIKKYSSLCVSLSRFLSSSSCCLNMRAYRFLAESA